MATTDEQFIRHLRATFEVEAQEHLQAISSMLLELEKSSAPARIAATIEQIYREVHSLKGAARAVDLGGVEGVCQAMESVFSILKRASCRPDAEAFDAFHRAVDMVRSIIAAPQGAGTGPQYDALILRLGQIQGEKDEGGRPKAEGEGKDQGESKPAAAATLSAAEPGDLSDAPDKSTQTVRISIAKLDARLLQAEDLLTMKAISAQRAEDLRELARDFAQWRNQWALFETEVRQTPLLNRAGDAPELPATFRNSLEANGDLFRSLGNRLATLAGQARQDQHQVGKRIDDLLEDTKRLLMLPLATLTEMCPELVRDLCREQDKQAQLVMRGMEIEVDKRILEEMKDALIHILRNCVDHGVERREDRIRAGKDPCARLTLSAAPLNGNNVEVVVSDDGAGIDVERVKESALRQGVIADASLINDTDALSLIFHSEVTTSPSVTAISGRGLGMAIARAKVDKLGGRIAIESRHGAGTTLRMVLPLTLATFRGVLVMAGGQEFIVPTFNVERVFRVKAQDIRTVENRETVSLQGRVYSLARLAAVLDIADTNQAPAPVVSVLLLHGADQRIALAVDEVRHEAEVLVKPFRKPLGHVPNIAGATVLGSGKVVPVINVMEFISSARTRGAAPTRVIESAPTARKARVLIVEDSVTSRMLLKGIIESSGYEVETAVDGVAAYATLREREFELIVSDVEMPRMNGFDLTARIRADKRLADKPVILVTALESPEQRERGIDAGANAYIVKSSFDQGNLLEVIKRLI